MPKGTLLVAGKGLPVELQYANTLLGRTYVDEPIATAADDLAALPLAQGASPSPWIVASVPGGNVTSPRFDGISALAAFIGLASALNYHVRFHPTARQLEIGSFGAASGVVLLNAVNAPSGSNVNPNIGLITGLQIIEESNDLVNVVIPIGEGEGNNVWTLKYATRSVAGGDPYDVQTGTGPDGQPYYYLEDTTWGGRTRTKVLSFKDVAPVANSALAFELASNALYDLGATALQRSAMPQATYNARVTKLEGSSFRPGDTVRLLYNGVVEEDSGRRSWRNIDANVVVLEKKRSFAAGQPPMWDLTISTVGKWRQTDQEVMIGMIETLQAFKTAVKPYTNTLKAGPLRESIAFTGSKWFTFRIIYRANVQGVLQAYLNVQLKALKSNVTDAASGGGSTSSAGESHSHSVSGGTSGGGSSHSHGLNTNVTAGPAGATVVNPSTDPVFSSYEITDAGGHWHDHEHSHELGEHTHFLQANTSNAESSHTHSFSGSTSGSEASHRHTISAHTHALVYGIFESSLPAAAAVQVWINGTDRTAALGGPWNADFSVDVTAYLTDANGRPLWGSNTIQFRKASTSPDAIDIIADVDSLVIGTALQPA